jgi:hypothetical protein
LGGDYQTKIDLGHHPRFRHVRDDSALAATADAVALQTSKRAETLRSDNGCPF